MAVLWESFLRTSRPDRQCTVYSPRQESDDGIAINGYVLSLVFFGKHEYGNVPKVADIYSMGVRAKSHTHASDRISNRGYCQICRVKTGSGSKIS